MLSTGSEPVSLQELRTRAPGRCAWGVSPEGTPEPTGSPAVYTGVRPRSPEVQDLIMSELLYASVCSWGDGEDGGGEGELP